MISHQLKLKPLFQRVGILSRGLWINTLTSNKQNKKAEMIGTFTFQRRSFSWTCFLELTESQRSLKDLLSKFSKENIAPIASKIDRTDEFPRDIFYKMGELGLMGLTIPSDYGGSEMGYVELCIAVEELSRYSGSIGLSYAVHSHLCINLLNKWANEEIKKKFLPKMCKGELLSCMAISEHNAGSDVISMGLTAEKKGDKFIVNGSKMWTTNGPVADLVVLYAKTDPKAKAKGISVFLVEKDFPGFKVNKKLDKLGMRGSSTAELVFENCIIPERNLIGEINKGVQILMSGLNSERLVLSAAPIGLMQAALDLTLPYVNTREQFGQKIGTFQLMMGKTSEMYVKLQSSRSFTYALAKEADKGLELSSKDCAAALMLSSENAVKVTLDAIQSLGGNGYINEFDAGRLLRDAKCYEFAGGSSEIRRVVIGRELNKEFTN